MSKFKVLMIAAGLLAGAGLAWLALPYILPHQFHGTVVQSPDTAPDFSLASSQGGEFRLADQRGKLVMLYFGYTFCPDVCPNTLGQVKQAQKALGRRGSDVQVVMISVDPQRDTPEVLARYLKNFDPSWIGASGSEEQVAQAAALYGIYYEKHPGSPQTGYLVDHTATVMVIDADGHLKLVFPFGTTGEDMADDLAYLMR
ncbi:MAG: SCO family protein [Chloroflexota bacterium]